MTDWTKERHAAARKACEEADVLSGSVVVSVPAMKAALDEIERLQGLMRALAVHGEHQIPCDNRDETPCDCGWSELLKEIK